MVLVNPAEMQKRASDVAGVCKKIVRTATVSIGKGKDARLYVKVEGWQAIANAFGCTASARDVKKVFDEADDRFLGFKAIGEVKRTNDGVVVSQGEGFIGVDEPRWFGGKMTAWDKQKHKYVEKEFRPAPEYMARAMAQTRAISRACRAAFAFVVVMIDEKLSTTPAEEMEPGDEPHGEERVSTPEESGAAAGQPAEGMRWQAHRCTYGTKNGPLRGKLLGELTDSNLGWLWDKFLGNGKPDAIKASDLEMVEGLKKWKAAAPASPRGEEQPWG